VKQLLCVICKPAFLKGVSHNFVYLSFVRSLGHHSIVSPMDAVARSSSSLFNNTGLPVSPSPAPLLRAVSWDGVSSGNAALKHSGAALGLEPRPLTSFASATQRDEWGASVVQVNILSSDSCRSKVCLKDYKVVNGLTFCCVCVGAGKKSYRDSS
jgi:hypothetical protein